MRECVTVNAVMKTLVPFLGLLQELSSPQLTLSKTKQLHALIIRTDLSREPFYLTKLVRFYSLNNLVFYARRLFDRAPLRSVFLWNSMIRAYAQANNFEESVNLFNSMLKSDIVPDIFTYACLIRACSDSFTVDGLGLVHAKAVASGFSGDAVCSSALASAYSRLGLVSVAERVFQGASDYDLVMCNSMINGYGFCGLGEDAFGLFNRMRSLGILPDGYSFVGLVSGFADSSYILTGQGIHALCLRSGYLCHGHVGSAFISMYARFKMINLAHEVFKELLEPDLVAWSALLTGYCQCGDNVKVLSIFRKMNDKNWKEDRVLIASVVNAVAQLADARPGKEIHASLIRHNLDSNVIISSALVDMYMKCGNWDMGLHLFENMAEKNTVTYNSVVLGLGLHGQASRAFVVFKEMLDVRVNPDSGTFAALLSACYHAGLGKDGKEIFRRMVDEFCMPPMTEHNVYMVKILGTEGELEEACDFIKALPGPVDPGIWGALLSCCEMHGDTVLADFVAQQLYKVEPEKVAYQVMLSNIYAGNERWSDVKSLRDRIGGRCSKTPGISVVA